MKKLMLMLLVSSVSMQGLQAANQSFFERIKNALQATSSEGSGSCGWAAGFGEDDESLMEVEAKRFRSSPKGRLLQALEVRDSRLVEELIMSGAEVEASSVIPVLTLFSYSKSPVVNIVLAGLSEKIKSGTCELLKILKNQGTTLLHEFARIYQADRCISVLMDMLPDDIRVALANATNAAGKNVLASYLLHDKASTLMLIRYTALTREHCNVVLKNVEGVNDDIAMEFIAKFPDQQDLLSWAMADADLLHGMAEAGWVRVIKVFLEKFAGNVVARDEWLCQRNAYLSTALHRAVALEHPEIVDLLVNSCSPGRREEFVCKVNICCQTAVDVVFSSSCVLQGDENHFKQTHALSLKHILDSLRGAGIDPDACRELINIQDAEGKSTIHRASTRLRGCFAMKELLSLLTPEERFYAISLQDVRGDSALHCASPNMLKTLLGCGLSDEHRREVIMSRNKRRETPLHICQQYASFTEFLGLSQLLVGGGADINAQDVDGNTPLHSAVIGGSKIATSTLLRLGADKTITNAAGQTPYDCALAQGYQELVDLLKP